LFDPERKRALPYFPRQIGIVTSPQAAALRDVLRTLANRMPGIPVLLYPTPVQGSDAAQKIAAAIREANERGECDTLIVCRGGGSIEDLWAFNEEVVARAIADSRIPVVSGVGHETDFTIADFVADMRAATPTAAAQAAVPDAEELKQRLQLNARHLVRAISRSFEKHMQQLDYLQRRLIHPAQRMQQQRQHLLQLQQRLQLAHTHGVQRHQWRWQALRQRLNAVRPDLAALQTQQKFYLRRLQEVMALNLERQRAKLASLQQHLQHLDPTKVLARGYSMVRDENGKIVVDSTQVAAGEMLNVTFARGWVRVEVKEKDARRSGSN
jgi:exodeoxyribonuclease VII large subunit